MTDEVEQALHELIDAQADTIASLMEHIKRLIKRIEELEWK